MRTDGKELKNSTYEVFVAALSVLAIAIGVYAVGVVGLVEVTS